MCGLIPKSHAKVESNLLLHKNFRLKKVKSFEGFIYT